MIGYGIELEMTVNHQPVKPCACASASTPHWAVADLIEALGRVLTDADAIQLNARVKRIADHDGTPA